MTDLSNVVAERRVLGCIMAGPAAEVAPVVASLVPEDFTVELHRVVLEAARTLLAGGIRAEPALVIGELRRTGRLSAEGSDPTSVTRLIDLTDGIVTWLSLTYYVRDLLEMSLRRGILAAGQRLAQAAAGSDITTLHELLDREVRAVRAQLAREIQPQVAAA